MKYRKNGGFQERLLRLVRARVVLLIAMGAALFAAGLPLTVIIGSYRSAAENAVFLERKFSQIDSRGKAFLTDLELNDACVKILSGDSSERIDRFLFAFRTRQALDGRLILCDKGRNIVCDSQPAENEAWAAYRRFFNKSVCDNTFQSLTGHINAGVCCIPGADPDYVLSRAVYMDDLVIGYLNLYIHGRVITEFLSSSAFDGVITDSAGRVIYTSRPAFVSHTNKFIPGALRGLVRINSADYLLCGRETAPDGVYVYSLLRCQEGGAQLIVGGAVILMLSLGWLLVAHEMSQTMAQSNAGAIREMIRELQIIERTDPDYRISLHTNDEFQEMGEKINQMLDSIRDLNQRNTEMLQRQKTAEIGQLTAQFSPHFLYNTLETLRNLMIFEPAAADGLILKLTKILRYSISDRREEVTLRQDMEYVETYIDIQKLRYGTRLCYENSVEEACYPCVVSKLLLQPIIENSIKYGFRKKDRLHIWVDGYVSGDMLFLSVTDDGAGMDEAQLRRLNETVSTDKNLSGHNGLHNIARRLVLKYGSDSGMELRAAASGGLQVFLKIRQPRGEEKSNV